MKKSLTWMLALVLILTSVLPVLAEDSGLPNSLVPTQLMMKFNIRLPDTFSMMASPDPGEAMEKYMLSNPEMRSDGMQFSNDDGTVLLAARGGSGFTPTGPANELTFTIASDVNVFDAVALKVAFLGAVSDLDASVTQEDLIAWMPGASETEGSLALEGYVLSYHRSSEGQELALIADSTDAGPQPTEVSVEAPVVTAVPVEPAALPECFIPQVAAQNFNGLLGPMLEMLGAPDPGTLAEQYTLTRADIQGSVLYLSSADGRIEINAYFEDGQPAVDKQATTLGLGLVKDVDRSELLSVGATFAYMVCDLDSTAGDFGEMLDWMSDAVDSGSAALRPMNGYVLAYAPGENGYIFTLVPEAPQGGGDAGASVESEPTEAPTAEPTPEPEEDPDDDYGPYELPDLPDSLDGAVLSWNGVIIQPLRYNIHSYSSGSASLWLYFRVVNNTDGLVRVQANDITVDGVEVHGGSVGEFDPYVDTGDDPSDFFLIMPGGSDEEASTKAIVNARRVKMTLVLKDDGYNKLYSETVTIDLDDLKGQRDEPKDSQSETSKSTSSSGNDKKPASTYRTLSQGDKGDDVKRLQQKLIELGYLNDVADGEYGPKTAAAVQALNEANGLGSSRSADSVTQDMVFSGLANPYTEPDIPVDLPYLQWDRITGDGASYRVKITNTSKNKTIKGVALRYYVTDVWGDRIWGSSIYREFTDTVTIKPGETKYSNWWYMTPSWYSIDQVHVWVSKVAFTDGTINECNDDYSETYFTLH